MQPEKVLKVLTCECGAAALDNSKYRGRFNRRHKRDNVCGNYATKQADLRSAQAINEAAKKATEGNDGVRVDMSGDANSNQQLGSGALQENSK